MIINNSLVSLSSYRGSPSTYNSQDSIISGPRFLLSTKTRCPTPYPASIPSTAASVEFNVQIEGHGVGVGLHHLDIEDFEIEDQGEGEGDDDDNDTATATKKRIIMPGLQMSRVTSPTNSIPPLPPTPMFRGSAILLRSPGMVYPNSPNQRLFRLSPTSPLAREIKHLDIGDDNDEVTNNDDDNQLAQKMVMPIVMMSPKGEKLSPPPPPGLTVPNSLERRGIRPTPRRVASSPKSISTAIAGRPPSARKVKFNVGASLPQTPMSGSVPMPKTPISAGFVKTPMPPAVMRLDVSGEQERRTGDERKEGNA